MKEIPLVPPVREAAAARVPASFREWANGRAGGRAARRWPQSTSVSWRTASAITLAGIVLGVLGPFGSFLNGGWPMRCAYWVLTMWAGALLLGGALRVALRRAPARGGWRLAFVALAILAASLPEAVLSHGLAVALWPGLSHAGIGWAEWYLETVVISTIATGAALFRPDRHEPVAAVPLPVEPRVEDRVPATLPPGTVALQMEDHYVRAHTGTGSVLLHMTMTDAIAAQAHVDGLRTHRSWWVARDVVQAIEGTPRAMRLRLRGGLTAPVSRGAVASLREAGWLDEGAEARRTD